MDNKVEVSVPRPRRSPRQKAAAFAVLDGGLSGRRPDPPPELTPEQAEIWRKTVADQPADLFKTYATHELLKNFCCHCEMADKINRQINTFQGDWMRSKDGRDWLRDVLKLRMNETRQMSLIATRLRMTNQSRYTPQAAATAARNSATVRPWEEA